MTRPTVAQAEAWQPDSLRRTADDWDAAAVDLQARVDAVLHGIDGSRDFWTGSAAEAARRDGGTVSAGGAVATRCLITAAVAARDGAEQIGSAKADVLDLVATARTEGFVVADDGSVTGGAASPLLVVVVRRQPAGDLRRAHDPDHGGPRPAGCGRRRHRPRHRRGAEPAARSACADRPGRGLAGSACRRRRGLVGDRPGPDREPDRRR